LFDILVLKLYWILCAFLFSVQFFLIGLGLFCPGSPRGSGRTAFLILVFAFLVLLGCATLSLFCVRDWSGILAEVMEPAPNIILVIEGKSGKVL